MSGKQLRYLSVCSGIEAASQAWSGIGFEPVAFSEIEPFPCAALKHHYPTVPNWGDLTRFREWPDATVNLLVGGTPCQSFSVAGLRAGLADPRGNLALVYLAVADRYRPDWLVWENVPGVLSSVSGEPESAPPDRVGVGHGEQVVDEVEYDETGDFRCFLAALTELGYGWAYRILDAQYFGVPQRRRRVFVVGHLGDWRRAAAVLFEPESLSGHPAPRRAERQGIAPSLAARTRGGGGLGTDFDCDGGLIPQTANPLTARMHKGVNTTADEGQTMIAHALRADGFDAGEDGTGRGTPIIAIQERAVSEGASGPDGAGFREGIAYTLEARHRVQMVAASLTSGGRETGPHGALDGVNLLPVQCNGGDIGTNLPSLRRGNGSRRIDGSPDGGGQGAPVVPLGMQVRRLTPRECERLQGFPDDYTLVPYRGKPAADGPRYKALGNSFAVPVVKWIGQRIQAVEALHEV